MPERDWRTSLGWGPGLFVVVALILAGCGDSGSASRRAAGLTGSSTASEGHHDGSEAEVQGSVSDKAGVCPTITFKVSGVPVQTTGATQFKGRTCQTLTNTDLVEVEGQLLSNGTIQAREVELRAAAGAAPAAGEVEVQGVVSDKAGACPTLTFKVGGAPVQTTAATKFEGKRCVQLANGDVAEVEGRRVNGFIRAREVEVRVRPVAGPGAVIVALVGPVTIAHVARGGKFEFEDLPPGTYNLTVTVNGPPGCTVVLAAGIVLTGPDNEVEGRVVTTGNGPCGVRLAGLEVKPGKPGKDDDEDEDDEDEDREDDDDD